MMDLLTWPIVIGVAVVIVLILVAVFLVTLRRAQMRKALGLPPDTKLGEQDKKMFQAFEDTDMRLGRNMPKLTKGQRQVMAREILRQKGLMPKDTKKSR